MKNDNCAAWVVSRIDRTGTDETPSQTIGVYDNQSKARECVLMWLFDDASDEGAPEGYNGDMNTENFVTAKAIWRIEEFEMNTPLY